MVSREQEEKILEEIKLLVKLFLENNKSDIELSKETGISSSTVGRRLTDSVRIISLFGEKAFSEIQKRRDENLMLGKQIGGQKTMANYRGIHGEDGKFQGLEKKLSPRIILKFFYKDEEKQYKLLAHMALTYRVKLDSLAQLFHIDENEIFKKMQLYCRNFMGSLMYLFEHDYSDQEIAKTKLLEFYRQFLNAKSSDERLAIVGQVCDANVAKLTSRKSGDHISEEEIIEVLKWQLKYATTTKIAAEKFNYSRTHYIDRLNKMFSNLDRNSNPELIELKSRYEYLSDYNSSLFNKNNYGNFGGRNA